MPEADYAGSAGGEAVTTPGGVPNLPTGALTIGTLASKTQDMTPAAMRARAAERMPSLFDTSSGGNALNDLTPFGILTQIWAGFNSVVANADPADVQGPSDLPGLLIDFIESLPVIGELVGLLDAILGTYTGDDPILLEVQTIFAPIRAIVDALTALAGGTGGLTNFFPDLLGILGLGSAGLGTGSPTIPGLSSIPILGPILGLFGGATNATQANNFFTNLLSFLGTPTLTGATGTFDPTSVATNFITSILNPTGLIATLTSVVDAIFQAVFGIVRDPAGDPTTDLGFALTNIPFSNVLGIGGPADIGSSIQSTWDNLISGLVGAVGTGAGLADVFNISQTVSSSASLGRFSWDVLGIRNNRTLDSGLLPTSTSNMPLSRVVLAGSAPTFAVTSGASTMAFDAIKESQPIGVVRWHGSGNTSITDFRVNVWKMDRGTGGLTLMYNSANIVGDLSASTSTPPVVSHTLSSPIAATAGEVYGYEFAVTGSGTHNIVGASSWMPNDATTFPKNLAATRASGGGTLSPGTTIASGSVAYAANVPFVEVAITTTDVPVFHDPQTTLYNTPGSATVPIPTWANYVEAIPLGAGGGGHQGGTLGIGGAGGHSGSYMTATWARGTEFTGTVSVSITVGAGGAGGGGNGTNGGNTVVSIPGHSLTATGGAGATSLDILGTAHAGQSPGNTVYSGQSYVGGLQQDTYGAAGAAPGGGGAGGNWISFQSGGNGANGAVWLRFRQT